LEYPVIMNRLTRNSLFPPEVTARFPSTRYQGSKAKLTDWIWSHLAGLDFCTCLDAFGGTGVVSSRLKQEGKQVTYNDILRFNYYFGLALVENDNVFLEDKDISWVLKRHKDIDYPTFIQDTFGGIYFTDEENAWLDQTITNTRHLDDRFLFALSFFALAQSCIVKRPYNLFHRKNLYVRLADVKRSFGNKASWDRPFPEWFKYFAHEANQAVAPGIFPCRASNKDAMEIDEEYDLVYIDTPYISRQGVAVDYADFYHFLEGLCFYDRWKELIDWESKHRRMLRNPNPWTDKKTVHKAFDELFSKFSKSIIVVSYRSDGVPSINELSTLLKRYKSAVRIETFGRYKYVLSKNGNSKEALIIGT